MTEHIEESGKRYVLKEQFRIPIEYRQKLKHIFIC